MSKGNLFDLGLGTSYQNKKIKRTLGIRDKQILYELAKGKCESCGRKIEFSEMQTGHKTAASKGGNATLRNSVCLCYKCNKLQGTDSWATFMKKKGKSKTTSVTTTKRKKSSNKSTKKIKRKPNDDLFGLPEIKLPEFKPPKINMF